MGYLIPKPFLSKNSNDTILSISEKDKGFHAFTKSISLKVNVIAWLEFELTYYDIAVKHVNHLTLVILLGILQSYQKIYFVISSHMISNSWKKKKNFKRRPHWFPFVLAKKWFLFRIVDSDLRICLGFFVLMAYQPSLVIWCQNYPMENQQCYYLTYSQKDRWFHAFSKGISPKVNVIAWLEFEPIFFVIAGRKRVLVRNKCNCVTGARTCFLCTHNPALEQPRSLTHLTNTAYISRLQEKVRDCSGSALFIAKDEERIY